jgi:hypothetical protein
LKLDNCIIRKAKTNDNPFVMISRMALQNPRLSFKARGLLAYILSLPDDWKLYIRELTNHSTDGKFAIRSALSELRKAGHIKGVRLRNEKGIFQGYEFVVFEDPAINVEVPASANAEKVGFDEMYHDQISRECSEAGLTNTNHNMRN